MRKLIKVVQQLLKDYYHTFKHLLEFHCLTVCLRLTFWVAWGPEIGMFASSYVQKINQKTIERVSLPLIVVMGDTEEMGEQRMKNSWSDNNRHIGSVREEKPTEVGKEVSRLLDTEDI